MNFDLNSEIGVKLASRLGLQLNRREGHDLAGPCIDCKSSDAFRLHQQTGVGYCYSCQGKWSPFQIAERLLQDRERAKAILVELGIFQQNANVEPLSADPVDVIARQKGITPESLRAFGAKAVSANSIQSPAYDPDGKPCTTFTMTVSGGKGLFAEGKKAGLFFPHVNGKVRLPQPEEIWQVVEGPKDAAALFDLGLLACGMNTSRMAAKFARLFAGVEVILVPDRDRAGEEGGRFSTRVLRGVAKTVRIAVLPAEFKESKGEDVRDVLRRPGGRAQVLQAITDARLPDGWEINQESNSSMGAFASTEISLPDGDLLNLKVSQIGQQSQRLVIAIRGEREHRDRINTNSNTSRERFSMRVAAKFGIERDLLAPLIEPKLTKLADEIDKRTPAPTGQADEKEQSQATLAVNNMAAQLELWHTPSLDAFATIAVDNHEENWPVRSQRFKQFVSKQFYDKQGEAMNSESLGAALNLLEAKALFDGEEHCVHVRVGEHGGNIFLDLCNPDWQVVQVTPEGWRIVDDPPIRFRRAPGMLPLPAPQRGGNIGLLRDFVNLDDTSWRLAISGLVAMLRPRGPYPVLALFGEQGSGKSTVERLLRELVDPNDAPLRAEPRNGRDLMIAANNSWCLAYDNLSHIPQWLSDALCRLSTGGGFTTRKLFTDQDEVIIDLQRPVFLNSIEEVATRSDLLDRCLIVWLLAIPEDRRRPEAELFEAFRKVRPLILGALLDAVAIALTKLPSINLPGLPRMADFALWATAAETGFGWPAGAFMAAYLGNRESANDVALEASVVAGSLLELLEAQGEWIGSSGELLKQLEDRQGDRVRRLTGWPKNPRSLSGHLKRLAPNLRKVGWIVDRDRNSKKRTLMIRRGVAASGTSAPSFVQSPEQSNSMQSDADLFHTEWDDPNVANDANAAEDWDRDRF